MINVYLLLLIVGGILALTYIFVGDVLGFLDVLWDGFFITLAAFLMFTGIVGFSLSSVSPTIRLASALFLGVVAGVVVFFFIRYVYKYGDASDEQGPRVENAVGLEGALLFVNEEHLTGSAVFELQGYASTVFEVRIDLKQDAPKPTSGGRVRAIGIDPLNMRRLVVIPVEG